MALVSYFVIVAIALLAARIYRNRLSRTSHVTAQSRLTAASITTIEAAFLRGRDAAVASVRDAAERCGAPLDDPRDIARISNDLAARGLTVTPDVYTKLGRLFGALCIAAIGPAAFVARTLAAAGRTPHHATAAGLAAFAAIWGATVYLAWCVISVNHTERGRNALAMRRAAYPLHLIRESDPVTAVALYGGGVRRKSAGATGDGGDSGVGEYTWAGSGGDGHHGHGDSGHGSHGCGGSHGCSSSSSCGSGGCGA